MSRRNIPPVPFGASWETWALELNEYLTEPDQHEAENTPVIVQLTHQLDGQTYKALEDGILMYDPANDAAVISISNEWVPLQPRIAEYGVNTTNSTSYTPTNDPNATPQDVILDRVGLSRGAPFGTFNTATGVLTLTESGDYKITWAARVVSTNTDEYRMNGFVAVGVNGGISVYSAAQFYIRNLPASGESPSNRASCGETVLVSLSSGDEVNLLIGPTKEPGGAANVTLNAYGTNMIVEKLA